MSCPPRRFLTLWAINGPLDRDRLREQLEDFRKAGFDGVVFHPRSYPGRPPYLGDDYLRELSQAILHAKSLGMAFWIYDENGWPSGTADGELFRSRPADVCQRLDLVPGHHEEALLAFDTSGEGNVPGTGSSGHKTWSLVPRRIRGLDCLNPLACHRFLAQVHERYRTALDQEAFDYIEAFFTDEPEFGLSWEPMPERAAVPWSSLMPAALQERFGSGATSQLPLLFFPGEGAAAFRVQFWEFAGDMFLRGFFDPYREWCERWGKKFVGHVKGEEHPLFQLPMVGSCHRIYRGLSLPGIDALERGPANHFFPAQAASVAWQFGNGECLAESFGGAGWGSDPADLERYLLWLGNQGITDFVLHLSQYRLDSAAIRDWPPSHPFHVTWREAYPEIIRRVRGQLTGNPMATARTLLIVPCRGVMENYEAWEFVQTNIHNAATYPATPASAINRAFLQQVEDLHACGEFFHLSDERTFEESAVPEGRGVRLGNMVYDRVVAGHGASLSSQATRMVSMSHPTFSRPANFSSPDSLPIGRTLVLPTWRLVSHPINSMPVEILQTSDGFFQGIFACDRAGRQLGLSVRFADAVRTVFLNDREWPCTSDASGWIAGIPAGHLQEQNSLRFSTVEKTDGAFVWVEGTFGVRSRTPYCSTPDNLLITEGAFYISGPAALNPDDAISGGFPFLRHPLIGECDGVWPEGDIFLEGIACSAAAVRALTGSAIWALGPDWKVAVPGAVRRNGKIRLELVPNTLNYYGPHHYYRGDPTVVSPGQFAGRKNFADPPDAPVETRVSTWHFRPLRFPRALISA